MGKLRHLQGRQKSTKTLFMVELKFFTSAVHVLQKMALTYVLTMRLGEAELKERFAAVTCL